MLLFLISIGSENSFRFFYIMYFDYQNKTALGIIGWWLFSTRLHIHQRMNANGNWHQMIYFPETVIQWTTILVIGMLHYDCPMHNDTYSVHNRFLKPWWSRSLFPWPFCYVFSPPLSRLNWCSSSPFGGPGPPPPKWWPPSSAHTPSPESRTVTSVALPAYQW